jgi:hypothetical protein
VFERHRLPDRREAELVDLIHAGRRWTVTIGRFPDGRVGEVFLDTPKVSAIGEIAASSAVATAPRAHSVPLALITEISQSVAKEEAHNDWHELQGALSCN